MGEIKRPASLLVKHILFNGSVTQKRNALFERGTLPADFFELLCEGRFLLLKLDTGIQAELAVIGVEAEIAEKRSRQDGKN